LWGECRIYGMMKNTKKFKITSNAMGGGQRKEGPRVGFVQGKRQKGKPSGNLVAGNGVSGSSTRN